YLVRHAKKQSDGTRDPALTKEGKARAKIIPDFLKAVKFDPIYSTDYKRTKATAAPTANQAALDVTIYDPRGEHLTAFIEKLKESNGTYLVVGHSNTTAVVAGALSDQSLPDLHEHQYDRIYVVTRTTDGKTTLAINYTEPRTP
ncbi:MAG: phosphoglycerate mutase family protein, partial [Kordiimonas sp.]